MYRIALTPDKFAPGIKTWPTEDPATLFEVLPLYEALDSQFTSDAHFCCYTVRDAEGVLYAKVSDARWPRINKIAVPALTRAGVEVLSTLLVFDYDLKDNVEDPDPKVPWTTEHYRMFVDDVIPRLKKALGDNYATYVYLTNHGARFIHVLAKPLPVGESEGYWNALFEKYEAAQVKVDPACRDWTRLFRLPRVTRDGLSTWTGYMEQFGIAFDPDKYVVPGADLAPVDWKATRDYSAYLDLKIETMDTPLPSVENALGLLRVGNRQTHAHKVAKETLQGRRCYPVFFEDQPIGARGERDHQLTSLVGEACRLLASYNKRSGTETFRPEHVYALFLPALDDLEPDPGTPSWPETAWSKILRFWAVTEAQVKAETREAEERSRDNVNTRLEGLRSWTDCTSIHNPNEDAAIDFMTKNLMMATPKGNVILLQPNGHYSRPFNKLQIYAAMAKLGLAGDLIQHRKPNKDGSATSLIPLPDLMEYYGCGTVLCEIAASAAHDHATVEGLGTSDARIIYPMARLNPHIEPLYSEPVEEWLRFLVSNEHLARLKKWLAYSLDFRAGPISALALVGPPSIGKKLLVQGLAECFEDHTVVPGSCLTNDFQVEMTRSLIVNVDEGLPKDGPGAKVSFKDKIRSLTGGDPTICNVKFGDPISVRAPFRVILTANNDSIVDGLVGLQLEHHDPEAIGMRVLRFEGLRMAADYLERLDTRTKRWITGDAGAPSNYVIARHFLWLYVHRADFGRPEGRFLVQGNAHEGIRKRITQSGPAQAILHALVRMIEDTPAMQGQLEGQNTQALQKKTVRGILRGLSLQDGDVWVTLQAIRDYCQWKDIETPRRDKQSASALVAMAPRTTAREKGSVKAIRFAVTGEERNVRWWPIDTRWILDYAFDSGICEPHLLQMIIAERKITDAE